MTLQILQFLRKNLLQNNHMLLSYRILQQKKQGDSKPEKEAMNNAVYHEQFS